MKQQNRFWTGKASSFICDLPCVRTKNIIRIIHHLAKYMNTFVVLTHFVIPNVPEFATVMLMAEMNAEVALHSQAEEQWLPPLVPETVVWQTL